MDDVIHICKVAIKAIRGASLQRYHSDTVQQSRMLEVKI